MPIFQQEIPVRFGDCDPAGIVFYPNYFRWMDAVFHGFLHVKAGGHANLCRTLGARGLGLMEAGISFRSPAIDGDTLRYAIQSIDWSMRSFRVSYRVTIENQLVLESHEKRGLFVENDERLSAAEVQPLRDKIG